MEEREYTMHYWVISTGKKSHETCELSVIWGKMKIIAWETASNISEKLLQRSKGWRSVLYMNLVKGDKCSQAHILAEGCC